MPPIAARSPVQTAVIGAGIVGLAIARRLIEVAGDAVTVLEKEHRVAAHQTSHNSGVAHAGVYYAPGSLKATLCRRGVGLLADYCDERGLAYEQCGKVIVARDASELSALDEIERRARANGVPGLRRVDPDGLAAIEPHVRGVAALHSPTTAIVDFAAVARCIADELVAAGGELRLGFAVAALARTGREVRVRSAAGETLAFDRVIVCAGLQSDLLARLAGDRRSPSIVPFRGEYQRLVPGSRELVRGLVYPVPDPLYPFLGVHLTRRIGGDVDIGPNAVLALGREGYRWGAVSARDSLRMAVTPGVWRMARRNWRTGVRELRGSLSRRAFLAEARRFVPELTAADVQPAPAGVRAQAVDADGSLVDDFRISTLDRVVIVRNAPSPAATSSLAIAEHVVDRLQR